MPFEATGLGSLFRSHQFGTQEHFERFIEPQLETLPAPAPGTQAARIEEILNSPVENAAGLEEEGFGVVPDDEGLEPVMPHTPFPRGVGVAAARGLTGTVLNEGEMEELAGFRQVRRVPARFYCCGGRIYAI